MTQEEEDLALGGGGGGLRFLQPETWYASSQQLGSCRRSASLKPKGLDTDHVRKPNTSDNSKATTEPDADRNIREPETSESTKETTDDDIRKPAVLNSITGCKTLERTPRTTGSDSENNIIGMLHVSREPHTVTKPSEDDPGSLKDNTDQPNIQTEEYSRGFTDRLMSLTCHNGNLGELLTIKTKTSSEPLSSIKTKTSSEPPSSIKTKTSSEPVFNKDKDEQ